MTVRQVKNYLYQLQIGKLNFQSFKKIVESSNMSLKDIYAIDSMEI
jgi:hypothetical protein